jgi:hypothetical protein
LLIAIKKDLAVDHHRWALQVQQRWPQPRELEIPQTVRHYPLLQKRSNWTTENAIQLVVKRRCA